MIFIGQHHKEYLKCASSFSAYEARLPITSRAGHVLLITWVYVSVVVVGYTYSSQLTASLTVQEVSPPFSSLQQLVSQDTYTWGMANGTAIQTLIKASWTASLVFSFVCLLPCGAIQLTMVSRHVLPALKAS